MPETQQDELTPPVLEVEKKEQVIEESPTDSLKLEVARIKMNQKICLHQPQRSHSQKQIKRFLNH